MGKVIPSGHSLGAAIEGMNLAKPLSDEEFEFIIDALGRARRIAFSAPAAHGARAQGLQPRASASSRSTSPTCPTRSPASPR